MRISSHDERRLSAALLRAYGMCEGDAETVAEAVTLSDMTGVYSHGLSRLTVYQVRGAEWYARPAGAARVRSCGLL